MTGIYVKVDKETVLFEDLTPLGVDKVLEHWDSDTRGRMIKMLVREIQFLSNETGDDGVDEE